MRWRVGKKLGRTLYRAGKLVGLVDTEEIAADVVAAMNGDQSAEIARLRAELRGCVQSFENIIDSLRDKHYEGAWSVACCSRSVTRDALAVPRRSTDR